MTELSPEQIAETEITVLVGDLRGAVREGIAPVVEELETLRGIAKRLADGWKPLFDERPEHSEDWTDAWLRFDHVTLCSVTEPMTSAEVQAIYGTGKETASDAH